MESPRYAMDVSTLQPAPPPPPAETPEERARAQLDAIMGRSSGRGGDTVAPPSVLSAQARSLEREEEQEGGQEEDETEQEATRRVAWIKHYIKLGDYDRAIELGWDGAPADSSRAAPSAASQLHP